MTESDSKLTSHLNSDKAAVRGNRVYNNIFEELQQRIRQGDWLPEIAYPVSCSWQKSCKSAQGLSVRPCARCNPSAD